MHRVICLSRGLKPGEGGGTCDSPSRYLLLSTKRPRYKDGYFVGDVLILLRKILMILSKYGIILIKIPIDLDILTFYDDGSVSSAKMIEYRSLDALEKSFTKLVQYGQEDLHVG